MKLSQLYLIIFLFSTTLFSQKTINLPSILDDNMVLQQKESVNIFGAGIPNSKINVVASWGEKAGAVVGIDSSWNVIIKTPEAGGPYNILITDKKTDIILDNVLIGEVWLCSGQSNMQMPLRGWPPNDIIYNSADEISDSRNNFIRLFDVAREISLTPKTDLNGEWEECGPSTAANFSATAYFFGKKLFEKLRIPIGLIHSSWGGTPAESWTSRQYLSDVPEFDSILQKINNSIPASIELNNWLNELEQIQINNDNEEGVWAKLNFNDDQYKEKNFRHNDWSLMKLPTFWEETELGNFDGVVWFRKLIELPENWLKSNLKLNLGPIDDFDVTYVNGYKVGSIEEEGNWQTNRNYDIPANIVIDKKLVIAIRVNDTRGGGGIYGRSEDLILVNEAQGEEISIAGKWFYQPIAEFRGTKYHIFAEGERSFRNRPKVPVELNSNTPTLLYNSMISPLINYKIKGCIWYQGESNTYNAELYERLFPTMINNWRNDFGSEFPFYYVQIAPYNYGEGTRSEFLRDAQRKTLSINNSKMIVTLDIGDTNNIHPPNKKDVGYRLANCALSNDYGFNVPFSGPIYKSMNIINSSIELEFYYSEFGLRFSKSENQFLIAGPDKIFLPAQTKVVGNKVVVWSDKVKSPLAVRYAWSNTAESTFFNDYGLPASSFRTDNWLE